MNGNLTDINENLLLELIDELDKAIGKNGRLRNIIVEHPADFWEKLLDLVCRLEHIIGPSHIDPNVTCLWGIALLTAAWTGCISKSKLYSTSEERPDFTDMERRDMSIWLRGLPDSISAIYSKGYNMADKLREKRGQECYKSWELEG